MVHNSSRANDPARRNDGELEKLVPAESPVSLDPKDGADGQFGTTNPSSDADPHDLRHAADRSLEMAEASPTQVNIDEASVRAADATVALLESGDKEAARRYYELSLQPVGIASPSLLGDHEASQGQETRRR